MEMQEIRKLNIDELMLKIDDSRKEHMDLRFKKASMQLNDSTEVRKIKKLISRLETRLTELRFIKQESEE